MTHYSPNQRRPSIYVVRPDPEDGIYDTDVYEPEHDDRQSDRLIYSLFGGVLHSLRGEAPQDRFDPPRPNVVPTSPSHQSSGGGIPGYRDPYYDDEYEPIPDYRRRRYATRPKPFFAMTIELGHFVGAFRLPVKFVVGLIVALILILFVIPTNPDVWQLILKLLM